MEHSPPTEAAQVPASGHEARRRRTRAAILTSAARLFERQGYAATSIAAIAADAGVSERAVYVHFPAKEDLLFAHAPDIVGLACRVAEQSSSPSAVERTRAAVLAMVDATTSDEALARQAQARAALAGSGGLPRSLAHQAIRLVDGLTTTIAAETHRPLPQVAPVVGAAIGAVQGAGYVAGHEGADPTDLRERMTTALRTALAGFTEAEAADDGRGGQP